MKFFFILSAAFAAVLVRAETKKCQPFDLDAKSTACTDNAGNCVTGSCKDDLAFLTCTCPDAFPHVKCGSSCS
ncbi:hypothetical protein CGRA01v4_10922 [Colletotrichum graminicola]|nr:hypothetical protein CGRA01v4_10922 [Colletotrichum graminicola]